jgi:hypothetical protein
VTPLAYIKLGVAALVVMLLVWGGLIVRGWHQDSLRVKAVETELQSLKASQEASQKASEQYQRELKEIRNRPVTTGPVRLCNKRPAVSPSRSGPSATLPATGVLQGADGSDYQEGPDIAADLLRLADEADEVASRGRATQSLHLRAK